MITMISSNKIGGVIDVWNTLYSIPSYLVATQTYQNKYSIVLYVSKQGKDELLLCKYHTMLHFVRILSDEKKEYFNVIPGC